MKREERRGKGNEKNGVSAKRSDGVSEGNLNCNKTASPVKLTLRCKQTHCVV